MVTVLGGFPALAGADLTISTGEVALLRGPNGAGKSTVLRVCAGLLPLKAGSARVLGRDVIGQRDDVRRTVGLLGHQTNLYDDLTVIDNLQFWTKAARAPEIDIDSLLARCLLYTSPSPRDATLSRMPSSA